MFWNTEVDGELAKLRARVHDLEQYAKGVDIPDVYRRLQILERDGHLAYHATFSAAFSNTPPSAVPVPLKSAVALLLTRAGVRLQYVPEHPAHYVLKRIAKPKKA